jgi:hypothetical protein
MAFNKTTTFDMISIRDDGVIEIRKKTSVDEDGDVIGFRYFRYAYNPGEDISIEPMRVRNIINIVWTPAVIAAWQAAHP